MQRCKVGGPYVGVVVLHDVAVASKELAVEGSGLLHQLHILHSPDLQLATAIIHHALRGRVASRIQRRDVILGRSLFMVVGGAGGKGGEATECGTQAWGGVSSTSELSNLGRLGVVERPRRRELVKVLPKVGWLAALVDAKDGGEGGAAVLLDECLCGVV